MQGRKMKRDAKIAKTLNRETREIRGRQKDAGAER
jgi:hypothetical protein